MKLAVKREEGVIPGSGYHYMMFPMRMESDAQAEVFHMMGYTIIEVTDDHGARLLDGARAALQHQVEVAILTDQVLKNA